MQNIRCQSVQEAVEIQQLQYLKSVLAAHLAHKDHKRVQQKVVDELLARRAADGAKSRLT